jgi:hypothetical protein
MSIPATQNMIEGTWEEISSHASEFNGHRLRVIILPEVIQPIPTGMITRGMFPQLANITEEAFKIAEFHGELDGEFDESI